MSAGPQYLGVADVIERRAIVDLTLPIAADAPHYPGDPAPQCTAHCTIEQTGYRVTLLHMGSHQGTHIDAPSHYLEDGPTLEDIPLSTFIGPAVLVPIITDAGADTMIHPEHFLPFEEGIRRCRRVVYVTNWSQYVGTPHYYTACPELSLTAAQWLVERGVLLVGMDTPSPSLAAAEPVHRLLLGAGVVILE